MKYTVIRDFADSQGGYYEYHVGDNFPHIGAKVAENRISQLLTENNKTGHKLIEEIEEKSESAEEKTKRVRKPKQV